MSHSILVTYHWRHSHFVVVVSMCCTNLYSMCTICSCRNSSNSCVCVCVCVCVVCVCVCVCVCLFVSGVQAAHVAESSGGEQRPQEERQLKPHTLTHTHRYTHTHTHIYTHTHTHTQ